VLTLWVCLCLCTAAAKKNRTAGKRKPGKKPSFNLTAGQIEEGYKEVLGFLLKETVIPGVIQNNHSKIVFLKFHKVLLLLCFILLVEQSTKSATKAFL
jgi:hypothetical protein